MPYPYEPPSFLQNQSVDEIHGRMMNSLPDDIDKSELQIPWDFTRPAAMEKAKFVEFELNETIKTMFILWATGEWLDIHARGEGLVRRHANRAFGKLTVTAKAGTIIEEGFLFATPANSTPSVMFEAMETVVFPEDSNDDGLVSATIPVLAVEGGRSGNVPPDSIILMVKPESNIKYITNPEATTGGTPEESDDDLRERILEKIRGGVSFVGCDTDYVRWAKEISGVGQVVVDPEWDDPNLPEAFHWVDETGLPRCAGAVRLFIVDANGAPANQQILDAVYEHIVSPSNRMERLAPIGAALTVVAPTSLYVNISAAISLKESENLETVIERFKANLDKYWLEASTENDIRDVQSGIAVNGVKYVFVGAVLAKTTGVADYSSLSINGGTANIPIALGQFPVTGEVDVHE